MTPNKEDYIKTIYKLGGKDEFVTNKAINQMLDLSAASTTEMLNKLVHDGTVEYIRYKGAKLTHKGIKVAERLIRSHKIWEVFLVNSLGFSGVSNVRIGKQIVLDIDENDKAKANEQLKVMCEELLANTVIEDYEIVL